MRTRRRQRGQFGEIMYRIQGHACTGTRSFIKQERELRGWKLQVQGASQCDVSM